MDRYYALFSGGVDSTLASLIVLKRTERVRVSPVFFDYDQKNGSEELAAVKELVPVMRRCVGHVSSQLDDPRVFPLKGVFSWSNSPIVQSGTGDPDRPDLENRNMILISCAASVVMADWQSSRPRGSRAFIIAGFKNEHYDTKTRFSDSLNRVFQAMPFPIQVVTPLISGKRGGSRVSAHALAKVAHQLDVLPILEKTWSCYYPRDARPCGACKACSGRDAFFGELKVRAKMKSP